MIDRDWYKSAEEPTDLPREVLTKRPRVKEAELLEREAKKRGRPKAPVRITKMFSISYWSEQLDFSADAIRTWIRDEVLEAHFIRGEWRVSETAMQKFLAEQDAKKGIKRRVS